MHKSSTAITFLLMTSLILLVPFTNTTHLFSNIAMAQSYDNNNNNYNNYYGDNDMYSKYPTKENKYECRTGPFQGFFVSSVEFCKFNKFDNDKDDIEKIVIIEIITEQGHKVHLAHKAQLVHKGLKVYQELMEPTV